MGKIVISTNVTLDGVVQDPDGKEGLEHGAWFEKSGGRDLAPWAEVFAAEANATAALLLGRRTDEWFGTRWNERTGAWAERLNALPKHVVSATAKKTCWVNGTLVRDVAEITKLKAKVDGDLVVYASYMLVDALFAQKLVDEIRLFVFPVVLGSGRRLFTDIGPSTLRLKRTTKVGEGLVHLVHDVVH